MKKHSKKGQKSTYFHWQSSAKWMIFQKNTKNTQKWSKNGQKTHKNGQKTHKNDHILKGPCVNV